MSRTQKARVCRFLTAPDELRTEAAAGTRAKYWRLIAEDPSVERLSPAPAALYASAEYAVRDWLNRLLERAGDVEAGERAVKRQCDLG